MGPSRRPAHPLAGTPSQPGASRRIPPRPIGARSSTIALLAAGALWIALNSTAGVAAADESGAERTGSRSAEPAVRSAEPGVSQPAALDAAMRALAAERAGQGAEAVFLWETAAAADPRSLAPRLALLRLLAVSRPEGASNALREAVGLVAADYTAQRWAAGSAMVALALGVLLASLLVLAGLVARHLRGLQHLVRETLARALPAGSMNGPLAWASFTLPFVAGLGTIGGIVFLAFASSFRFARRERMAALAAGAACLLIGPVLLATRPLWSLDPRGTDGLLIADAQRNPSSPPSRAAAGLWAAREPESSIPQFLQGLDDLRSGQPDAAAAGFTRAAGRGGIPPAVLETNLGSACFLGGDSESALRHYERASRMDPGRFEPLYDMSIVLATLGDYPGADRAIEEASRAGFDRLRDIGRTERGDGPRVPVEAPLSAADLWNLDLGRAVPAVPPAIIAVLLPLRNLWTAAPVMLLAALGGLLTGRRLRRSLTVHVCFQCGTPICRRCLVRIDRHAYCKPCGEAMGGQDLAETTRKLLRRLLDERPAWPARLRPLLLASLPGIGATVAGNASAGLGSALPAGLGLALLLYPAWGRGCLPLAGDPVAAPLLVLAGVLLLAAAVAVNALGVRAAERGHAGLRAFFERDVDRLAA